MSYNTSSAPGGFWMGAFLSRWVGDGDRLGEEFGRGVRRLVEFSWCGAGRIEVRLTPGGSSGGAEWICFVKANQHKLGIRR